MKCGSLAVTLVSKFAGGGHRVMTEEAENVHTALETDIFHLVTGAHIAVRGTGTAK